MALRKQKLKSGNGYRVSKNIRVVDNEGNKNILKATIVTVSKDRSQEILEDRLSDISFEAKIVRPPLNQAELSVLGEVSSELPQNIKALEIGIHGFGGSLQLRAMKKEFLEANHVKIIEEKTALDALFMYPNPKQSFRKLAMATRSDLEYTGNAYWELIRSRATPMRYTCINKMDVSSVFITKVDTKFTRMRLKYVDGNNKIRRKRFTVRFRKFVQVLNRKKTFFKEFGDPRVMDRRTGRIIAASPEVYDKLVERNSNFAKKHPKKIWANEIYHHKKPTSRRTPYGMPSHTGNIIAIKGSRSADETNILTQQNNHVPSMVVSCAGGQLTEGSINRLQEFIDTQIKGDSNYSKFLILEGEANHDSLSSSGSVKIDIKPLSEHQHKDQLWQKYDENNAGKIRRSFRQPPLMTGNAENLSRSVARESERFAEKYVYNPERESFDEDINLILMQQEFRFWFWKSNSPNVTNDEDIVKLLTGGEKTGGISPRIAHMLLQDVLGSRKLPPLKDDDPDFDVDLPFSLSLAKLMQRTDGAAEANRNGTMGPQGQTPAPRQANGRPRNNSEKDVPIELLDKIFKASDPHALLEDLLKNPHEMLPKLKYLRDTLEDELDTETFGEPQGDYFKHDHEEEDAA